MPKYHVTIHYRTPKLRNETFIQEVTAPNEYIASEKAEAELLHRNNSARIVGGSIFPIRAGKIVRPRTASTALRRRVIVIVPRPGTSADETMDFIVNELDRTKIETAVYLCPVHLTSLDTLRTEGHWPSVAVGKGGGAHE
jgi:hypothetical protein